MKPLPIKFTSKGFTHELDRRTGNIALFKRYQSDASKCHYEVIIVQSHNGRKIGDTFLEPAEFYPSTSTWGQYGWTYTEGMSGSREQAFTDAERKFDFLVEAEKVRATKPSTIIQTE